MDAATPTFQQPSELHLKLLKHKPLTLHFHLSFTLSSHTATAEAKTNKSPTQSHSDVHMALCNTQPPPYLWKLHLQTAIEPQYTTTWSLCKLKLGMKAWNQQSLLPNKLINKYVNIHEGDRSDRYHVHAVNGLSREPSLSVAPAPRTRVRWQTNPMKPRHDLIACAFLTHNSRTVDCVQGGRAASSRTIAITHAAISCLSCRGPARCRRRYLDRPIWDRTDQVDSICPIVRPTRGS